MYYLVLKFLNPAIQLGFTTLIISIWFLSGIIIACLGVRHLQALHRQAETGLPKCIA